MTQTYPLLLAVAAGTGVAFAPWLTLLALGGLFAIWLALRIPLVIPIGVIAGDMVVHPVASVGGYNVFAADLLWVPGVVVLLVRLHQVFAAFHPVRALLVLTLLVSAVSSMLAIDSGRAAVGLLQYIELLFIVAVTIAAVRTQAQVRLVITWAFLVLLVNACLALGQLAKVVPIPTLPLNFGSDASRVTGASGNALGTYLVFALCLGIAFAVSPPGRQRFLPYLGITAIVVTLLATGIRSAWLSAMVVGAALLLGVARMRGRTAHRTWLLASAGLFGLVLVIPFAAASPFGSSLVERASSISSFREPVAGSTTYARLKLWEASAIMIEEHPYLGVGPKNWVVAKYDAGVPSAIVGLDTREIADPHHQWLEVASEQGLLGLACYLGLFAIAIRLCVEGLRSWPHNIAIALFLVAVSRPVAQLAGGDVGSDKTWAVALGLILVMRQTAVSRSSKDFQIEEALAR